MKFTPLTTAFAAISLAGVATVSADDGSTPRCATYTQGNEGWKMITSLEVQGQPGGPIDVLQTTKFKDVNATFRVMYTPIRNGGELLGMYINNAEDFKKLPYYQTHYTWFLKDKSTKSFWLDSEPGRCSLYSLDAPIPFKMSDVVRVHVWGR